MNHAWSYNEPPDGETLFDLKGQPYFRSYDRCSLCGHMIGKHLLDLSLLYDRDYVDATYGGAEGMRQRFEKIMSLPPHKSDNWARVRRVLSFFGRHHKTGSKRLRVLDVGAGLGVFPAAMAENGWEAIALETDRRTISHLEEVAGVSAIDHDLLKSNVDEIGSFDLVTFNKVLEHVEDPVGLLASSLPLVGENGYVYIELPDVAAGVDGKEREEFYVEHHHVFSPTSVIMLASRASFEILELTRIRESSGKYTLFGFAISTDRKRPY